MKKHSELSTTGVILTPDVEAAMAKATGDDLWITYGTQDPAVLFHSKAEATAYAEAYDLGIMPVLRALSGEELETARLARDVDAS